MNDAQSVALITADESLRGGKRLRLKDTADAAVKGLVQIVLNCLIGKPKKILSETLLFLNISYIIKLKFKSK